MKNTKSRNNFNFDEIHYSKLNSEFHDTDNKTQCEPESSSG